MVSSMYDNSPEETVKDEQVTEENQLESTVGNKKLKEELNLVCGYRFSPYDYELIVYFLLRKILGMQLPVNIIPEIDLYHYDADQLPISEFKYGMPGEAYFFTHTERRYASGSLLKRTTNTGFWKASGVDAKIVHKKRVIGLKKTMVFYWGKAPAGVKSSWIMHEYRVNPNLFPQAEQDKSLKTKDRPLVTLVSFIIF
ncbi:hypothetical protein GH714_029970 [Hevea brasiliensis]|uniref:NAC domain-containing protein n=1 Tax=Hevea brasiliensis TaxID=3981 RepID=A0A6A6L2S6_HEVBR|nr:hypothetical protein GH714_029970 [Hevea brasiliensis]